MDDEEAVKLFIAVSDNDRFTFLHILFGDGCVQQQQQHLLVLPECRIPMDIVCTYSILRMAVIQKNYYMVQILLRLGARVSAENLEFFETADMTTLDTLLKARGLCPDLKTTFVRQSLARACVRGDTLKVRRFLREPVAYKWLQILYRFPDVHHEEFQPFMTPIPQQQLDFHIRAMLYDRLCIHHVHEAIILEHVDTLRRVLKTVHWNQLDTVPHDVSGCTALELWFTKGRNIDILRLLVAYYPFFASYRHLLCHRILDRDTATAIIERARVLNCAKRYPRFRASAEVFLFSRVLPVEIVLYMLTFCSSRPGFFF